MKNTTKAAMAGLTTGLTVILMWQLVSHSDLQRQLNESAGKMVEMARRRTGQLDEKAMLKRAELTNDPRVNQRWVEDQWDALS